MKPVKISLVFGLIFSFFVCIGSNSLSQVGAVDGETTYTGTNTNLTGDDVGAGPFNLGFTFNFYGTDFTQTYVNINGTINFSENYSRYNNVDLSTSKSGTNISDNSIYAFWDDLNTNASGASGNKPIYYATIGTAPNRKFVSQWTNIYFHSTTVQMGTFQIILYEGSNEVQIQYRDLLGNASQLNRELGNSATIGIRKDNTYRNQYSHNTASLTQGQAIRYTPSGANTYSVDTSAEYDLIYLAPEGAPTSPTLVTPTDGSTGVTLAPSFEWLPVESATNYRILVSTVSNFSTTVIDQTTANTSYTSGSNLSTSTQYYWRVQAINTNGSSLSPTRSFTTAASSNTAPNTPTSVVSDDLLDGASIATTSGTTLSMNLSDNDSDEQLRYRLQIATDDDFTSLVVDYRSAYSTAGEFTYTFGQGGGTYLVGGTGTVLTNGTYYLRLRAEDDSASSSTWYGGSEVAFTVEQNTAPSTPTTLGPAQLVNGSATSSAQPSLTFTLSDTNVSNTVKYTIEIDNNSDFSSPVIEYQSALLSQGTYTFVVGQSSGSGSYITGEPAQELANDSYYWRVRATDNHNESSSYAVANSGEIAFVVNSTVPGIDNIQATVISATSVWIEWDTDDATSSEVEYGLVPSYGFATAIADTSPRVVSHEVMLNSLDTCARYYYRVKSKNNANTEVTSSQEMFTTTGCPISSVNSGSEQTIPTSGGEFSHTQNTSVAKLVIPASFSDENVQFQINILNKNAIPTPPTSMALLDENFFNLVAVTESGVILSNFDEPISFSVTYSDEIKNAYQPGSIDVYKYDPDNQTWEKKNCSNDTNTRTITCSLPSFSIYSVFGVPTIAAAGSAQTSESSENKKSENSCNNEVILSRPDLFEIKTDRNEVTLYFVPSSGGASDYVVEYGKTPEANQHAVIFAHSSTSGAVPYTIHSLHLQETWYFKVRGTNGCVSSDWSETKSVFVGVASQNSVLNKIENDLQKNEATQNQLEEEIAETQAQIETDLPNYTVRIKVLNNEQPLKDTKIVLTQTQEEITTDENGYAIFEHVKGGLQRFSIIHQAYAAEKEIDISGEDSEFDIAITVVLKEPVLSTQAWLILITSLLMFFAVLLYIAKRKK